MIMLRKWRNTRVFVIELVMNSVLYHGSYNGKITKFEPRINTTPNGREMPPSVYATDIIAYAVAFGFPWSTDMDNVELSFNGNNVELIVPSMIEERINQKVYVYLFDSKDFELIKDAEPLGHNFVTQKAVTPIDVIEFESVQSALISLGSKVIIK